MGNELSVVGKPVKRKDGFERVTGRAKFYGDVQFHNMLHGKILRSPYAQADIASIDTSAAEALPGVELVMTHKNFPETLFKDLHYVGDLAACVIAVDEDTAEEACDLIKVEYEVKPFVVDPEEAMKPDSPRVFPEFPNANLYTPNDYYSGEDPETGLFTKKEPADFQGFGDVEQGFREADVIVEDDGFKYPLVHVPAQEPRGCTVNYEDGKFTVYVHSQHLHGNKAEFAGALGLPLHKVNLVSPYTGGAWGSKFMAGMTSKMSTPHSLIAGRAAMALGKPVRLALSREEEMLYGWSRGSFRTKFKIGFKADGTLTTIDSEIWVNASTGGHIGTLYYGVSTLLMYKHNCKHLRAIRGYVYTNYPCAGGWQGYGFPEMHFPLECVMDKAAEVLNIDPIELRKKNHKRAGDPLFTEGALPGDYLSSSGLSEVLDTCSEKIGWKSLWKHPEEKTGLVRDGLGVSLITMCAGWPGCSSSAIVKIYPDTTATLICGVADVGQGQHTTQPQIVAEALGIPYENVSVVFHDTDSTPYATFVGGSCATWQQGFPTYNAALDAKRQLLELAAPILEVTPEDLDIKDGVIYVKADPEKTTTFAKAFEQVWDLHDLIGYSFVVTPHGPTPKEKGAQFVSLDVDTETGQLKNIKVTQSQNVGQALNPKVVAGQFQTCHHGVEAMLGAECILDSATGRLLTDNWIDYPVATILDCDVDPVIVEVPGDPTNPYGATACGEGQVNPNGGAFSNAIYNALGIRFKELPFTPDKILKALGKI